MKRSSFGRPGNAGGPSRRAGEASEGSGGRVEGGASTATGRGVSASSLSSSGKGVLLPPERGLELEWAVPILGGKEGRGRGVIEAKGAPLGFGKAFNSARPRARPAASSALPGSVHSSSSTMQAALRTSATANRVLGQVPLPCPSSLAIPPLFEAFFNNFH